MQQTTGNAALVAINLPTTKTVTNATNATPIVVTATAHGVQTNEVISISGVGGNLAANGVFIAGSITTNSITLLAYPAGTSVAGTGGYTSGGSLQSLGYGITVPVPNDVIDPTNAASVNIALEALLDRTAYLLTQAQFAVPPPPVILGDASVTIAPGTGVLFQSYIQQPGITAARTLTLRTTTAPVPVPGQQMRVFLPAVGSTTSFALVFKREGTAATLGEILSGTAILVEIEFQFTAAHGWIVSGGSIDAEWSPGTDTNIYGF